jgi:hypothetical protein
MLSKPNELSFQKLTRILNSRKLAKLNYKRWISNFNSLWNFLFQKSRQTLIKVALFVAILIFCFKNHQIRQNCQTLPKKLFHLVFTKISVMIVLAASGQPAPKFCSCLDGISHLSVLFFD